METAPRRIPFKVDIAGVIEILGSGLYSRPDTAVRELIQNAHDAIMRRRHKDLSYKGRIDIEQDPAGGTLKFHDDGIGLTADEAETYLSTLGIGITGLIKGRGSVAVRPSGDAGSLIGQFGVGLFSAFMVADRLVVESRRSDASEGVRWEAGAGTDITLSSCERETPGTTVILHLKPVFLRLGADPSALEAIVKEYADFLPIPIHLNGGKARLNVINATWFDPTPDPESLELELESYFGETPLDVIPIRSTASAPLVGALYVTPRRTPGFAGQPVVTATIRRMVISRQIQGLLPEWASFLRGVIELDGCTPTLSREDLVRDQAFERARAALEPLLFEHLEQLGRDDLPRLESILAWHRYTLVGAALTERRLRDLWSRTYRLMTSQGPLTFAEVLERSAADPLQESDAERVVWFNTDRRQERWANALFAGHEAPCVHALRSFEESLLAAMIADRNAAGQVIDLRLASPTSANFARTILDVEDVEDAPAEWQDFLKASGAKILCASFREDQPVMAFLNERSELLRTFDDLRKDGTIPAGFQRMIDTHLARGAAGGNEVLLNRRHKLVGRALQRKTSHPLASVLRLLVNNALGAAGAAPTRAAQRQQDEDLDWIAEALWGRDQ
ncbi:ATP-binding protein [Singulisphaera sp. PoT]|uniref:ATP-binding protein n=1 Tax=Singulisphaera sp. PoT TaxID=3411797 RepID=UPI003BF46745